MNIIIPKGTTVWPSQKGYYGFLYPGETSYVINQNTAAVRKHFTGGNGKEAYLLETGAIVWMEKTNET